MAKTQDQTAPLPVLNLQHMDASASAVLAEARSAIVEKEFQKAVDLLLPLVQGGTKIAGLQLWISHCCEQMGQNRLARYYAFQECLDDPANQKALQKLDAVTNRVNGNFLDLQFNQTSRPSKSPTLSLAMIVKNEEKNLAACLECYKDLVSEIIVIDTGSTDRTVEIAKSFGARVEYFKWIDDFSAARNESLKYATCDWILRTDADEFISQPEKAKLLHAINSGKAEIYLCHTISKRGDEIIDGENVRLIKNHLGVQYESPLHEHIESSAIRLGLTRARTNIIFTHSGYEDESEYSGKIDRNIQILKQALQKDAENDYLRLVYGFTLLKMDPKEALRQYEKAVRNVPEDALARMYLGEAYCLLAHEYAAQGKFSEVEKIFQNLEIDFWFEPDMLQFEANLCLYQLGDWLRAARLLTWALRQRESSIFAGFFSPEAFNPKAIQALLFEANALAGRKELALKQYRQINPLPNDTPDALRQTALNQMRAQEWRQAYLSILLAGSLSDLSVQDYCNLADCQLRLRNKGLTEALLRQARVIDPNSPLISNTETLLAIRENQPQLALEKAVETFIFGPANPQYKANLEKVAEINHMNPVEALRKLGLEWLARQETQKALFALTIYSKFSPEDAEVKNILSEFTNI